MAKLISSIYRSNKRLRQLYKSDPIRDSFKRKVPYMMFCEPTNRYEVHDSYSIKEKLKRFGFRYDPVKKCWHTTDLDVALKASKYAIGTAKEFFVKLRRRP